MRKTRICDSFASIKYAKCLIHNETTNYFKCLITSNDSIQIAYIQTNENIRAMETIGGRLAEVRAC